MLSFYLCQIQTLSSAHHSKIIKSGKLFPINRSNLLTGVAPTWTFAFRLTATVQYYLYIYVWSVLTSLQGLRPVYSLCELVIAGQSYEIIMLDNRKIGELPEITGKMVKVRFWDASSVKSYNRIFCTRSCRYKI